MSKLFLIFLLWLALLLGVGYYSKGLPTNPVHACSVRNQYPFYRWDSFWYTSIARHGYSFSTEKNSSIAFFPLYPLVIHVTGSITHVHEDTVSLMLNVLFVALSVFFLYRLTALDFDDGTSRLVILVWLFFPPAYFLLSGYPEALFILLSILSLYTARKKEWLLAGIFSALLALTKPYGILMVPALFIEYAESMDWQWRSALRSVRWAPLLLPVFTFGAFVVFNAISFGHPLAFFEAQQTWGRTLHGPLAALGKEASGNLFSGNLLSGQHFPYLVYLSSLFFGIGAALLAWKSVRKSYLAFSFLLLLAALLTGTLTSFGRYMLLGFPILMGPAVFLAHRKKWILPYLILSGGLLLLLASLFVRCYPIE